ncbi:hypothetical protein WMF04_46810 [Sorangium sp. So ce260]|uniref:hypothetical protein n=1 Tax=Sorangium sp. So ce260 TaxID=3133291 RepID=UPI003F60F6D6
MPSVTHEALVELFKNRPTLAVEMLQDALGQPVPAFSEARVASSDLAEVKPSDPEAIGVAFLAAAAGLDEERRAVYGDLVLSSLNAAARRTLEAMMKSGYEFQSEFARSYVAKGRQEGREEGLREGTLKAKAHDVLSVIEARGLEVPTEVRERVLASTDLAELDRWIRRAAVVSDARELLGTSGS